MRPAIPFLVALAVFVLACRSEKRTQPQASASASVAPQASAKAASAELPLETPPQYRVFHIFPKDVRVFSAGSRLIACEACGQIRWTRRPLPRTWLIDAEQVEEDASLLPRPARVDERSLRYVGRYPDDVFAVLRFGHDEDTTEVAYHYLGRGKGNRFAPAPLPVDYNAPGGFKPSAKCTERCEPFESYLAEEAAEWQRRHQAAAPPPTAMLFGQGGPPLVVERRKMALWNGTSWVRSAAPWGWVHRGGAVRLSNGSSLVSSSSDSDYDKEPARDLFWVSVSGGIRWVDIATPGIQAKLGELRLREPVERDGEIWLLADADGVTVLLAPVAPSEAKRP